MTDLKGVVDTIEPPAEFVHTHKHKDGTPLMMLKPPKRTVTRKDGIVLKIYAERPKFVTEKGEIVTTAVVRKYPRGFRPQAIHEPKSDQVALTAAAAAVALQAGVPGLGGDIPGWTIEGYWATATNKGKGVISVSVDSPHGGSERYLVKMPEKVIFDLAPEHFEANV